MTPSELAVSLARIFAARDAQADVSIDDAWGLCVHRGQHSVSVRLSPDQRTLDAAVAAVRAAGQWGWALASPLAAASREQRTSSTAVGYDERTTVVTFAEAPLDEAGRSAIREAILEELAQAAEEMHAELRGSVNGWWTVKVTRTSDRHSHAGVVSVRTGQPGVLRKLTRSLMTALGRKPPS